MSAKPRTQIIRVDQLKPGMYVVKLDIPWIESPFLKHARLIKNASDIAKLKKAGSKEVVIDLDKGLIPDSAPEPPAFREKRSSKPASTMDNSGENPVKSLGKELNQAYQLRSQIKNTINNLNARLEKKLPIAAEEFSPLVSGALESLERNNQALLNLAHLSRKSQKLIDHTFSTFCLCLNLAIETKQTRADMEILAIAALLHDVGWLQLPLQLMGKRSRYTVTERKLVNTHLEISKKILASSKLPDLVLRLIAEHHELPDGSGYPRGLKGGEIHSLSKLLSVVDHYDECVHQLMDRPGMLPTNALRQLYRDAEHGKCDPAYVAGLINILGIYPVTSAVLLNTGEKGVVEQVFAEAHLEPIVRLHYDKDGRALSEPLVVDLRAKKEPVRLIDRVLDPANPEDDPEHKLIPELES